MKVLYHHRTRGKGAEGVHIRGVIDALKGLNHEVIVASLPGTEDVKISSGSLSEKMWKYVSARMPEIVFELFEIAYNFVSFPCLWNVVRKQKVDFIYERYALFNFSGALVSKIFNIPILLEINDISTLERVRKLRMKRLAGWFENRIFNSASALITISSYFESHLIERGFPKTKIWVIPNAIDPIIFNPENISGHATRAKYGLNSNIVIGFVGRFEYWHGIDLLISCIPEIRVTNKKVSFLLVGGNNEKDRAPIMNYASEKGILDSLIFSGWVSHGAIPSYIAAMDIAVIPNSNSYGSPMKLFEYMAMGKAVVAPRLGPIEDVMINDQNGIMFEPGDRNSLRDALSDLIENDDKRNKIGREASKTILAKHTWKNNGEKIIEIASSLTSFASRNDEKYELRHSRNDKGR